MTQRHLIPLAAGLAAFQLPSGAQTTPEAPMADETVKMEKFEVNAVPIEQNIIPSSRPVGSIYGIDRSLIETPRNATIISREQLTAISIQDPRDFSKLTASSYTRSNFGAPSTPDIRTQIADMYLNGMRVGLSSNGNGLPINFNAVESVNIVKGPATAVYGASQYVGGYADLITKRPTFDGAKGSVAVTAGSYGILRWTGDYNRPVSDKTAVRVSYSGEHSTGYYEDSKKYTEAVYAAVTHRASDRYEVFANAEYFWADYTENFGFNRPTQELIDTGLYQTGTNINNGTAASPADPQNARNVTSGFPVTNIIALGPKVKLDRRKRLLRPGDDSEGQSFNAQVIQTLRPADGREIVNNTFFRYVARNTLSSYLYSEIIDPSFSFENRTEFRFDTDRADTNTGFSLRYQRVEAFNDFFNEPAAVWDLTKDKAFIDFTKSVNFPSPFTQFPVPGWEGRYYTPFNGDSGVSKAFSVSPFVQSDYRVTDALSLLAGARVDVLSLSYEEPLGFLPSDKTTVGLPNVNASVVYKFNPALSAYATYNWSQNPVGSTGNGGGITTAGLSGYSNANLRNEAELIEAGSKLGFAEGRGFLSLAVFEQTRADLQQDRSVVSFRTRGLELEGSYQPTKHFYINAGYSYLDSEVNAPMFDVGNTTLTSPGDRFFSLPTGVWLRRQGVPQNLANTLLTYKFDSGLGFTAGVVWMSEINNNVAGTIVIPSQYTLDLTAFYTTKTWEVRVAVLNATDEENWSAPNAVYGNESIIADLPARVEATFKLKF